MFKKTLIAVAALGAFAGSAMAADITISGRIDTGLNYHHQKVTDTDSQEALADKDDFGMKAGQYSGSRVTIKGSEELGNGMKAGFILENGFDSDDGSFDSNGDDKIFGREAIVYLEGGWGHFSMGRVGALSSGVGSYNVIYGFTPWGTGWGSYAGNKGEFMLGDRGRMNNTVTYRSPEFAGFQVFAQYSFDSDGQEDEHTGVNKRYAGVGASYKNGAFATALVVDTVMNGRKDTTYNTEDSLGVSLGASYDLGVTKPMILVQYGKNENKLGGFGISTLNDKYMDAPSKTKAGRYHTNEGVKGFAVSLGTVTPLFGGNLYTSVNYTDGELDGNAILQDGVYNAAKDDYDWTNNGYSTGDIQRWGVAVGYDYPLSKRTKVYGFAAYNEGELKYHDYLEGGVDDGSGKLKEKDTEVGVGLIHYF